MTLSANTLFHFTKKQEYLISILEKGFSPRYCMEDISYSLSYEDRGPGVTSEEMRAAIPMSCFCDIRLTQTSYHAAHYGKFALGMTKQWGIEKTVTPLCYFHVNSAPTVLFADISSTFHKIYQDITNLTPKQASEAKDKNDVRVAHLNMAMGQMTAWAFFFKPINGKEMRNGQEEQVYYYDEREWRYIPIGPLHAKAPLTPANRFLPVLFPEQFEDTNLKEYNQDILNEHYSLEFSENDIKYIILPSHSELTGFREAFQASKSKLNYDLLATKIRFYSEIEEDQ